LFLVLFFFFSRVFYLFKHETQAIIVTRSQDTFEGQRGLWFLVSGFWSLTTRRELWWSWSLVLRPSAGWVAQLAKSDGFCVLGSIHQPADNKQQQSSTWDWMPHGKASCAALVVASENPRCRGEFSQRFSPQLIWLIGFLASPRSLADYLSFIWFLLFGFSHLCGQIFHFMRICCIHLLLNFHHHHYHCVCMWVCARCRQTKLNYNINTKLKSK